MTLSALKQAVKLDKPGFYYSEIALKFGIIIHVNTRGL